MRTTLLGPTRLRDDNHSNPSLASQTISSASQSPSRATTSKMVRVVVNDKYRPKTPPRSPTALPTLRIPYKMSARDEARSKGREEAPTTVPRSPVHRPRSIFSSTFSQNFPKIYDLIEDYRVHSEENNVQAMHAALEGIHKELRMAWNRLVAFADVENLTNQPDVKEEQVKTYHRLSRVSARLERLRTRNLDTTEVTKAFEKVESLLQLFHILNTVTVSASLDAKPLPPIPVEEEEGDEDESSVSVYHDALEAGSPRSSFVFPSVKTSVTPPSPPGLHARTDSSNSATASSGSSHTKVNSISSTLTCSTLAEPPKTHRTYVLPIETAFASLLGHRQEEDSNSAGAPEDYAESPRRELGDQLKGATGKSKLSLLSHKKTVSVDSLASPDTFSLAESEHSGVRSMGGLHRLKQITNSSKVSLLSYPKKKDAVDEAYFLCSDPDAPTVRRRKAHRRLTQNPLLDPTLQVLVDKRASMADAICLDTHGRVTGSTMTGIATVLTARDGFKNLALIHSVFSGFRSSDLATSADLVLELQNLFVKGPVHLAGTQEDHAAETRIYRARIARLVVFWFHYHWDDVQDYSAFGIFKGFSERILETDSIPAEVKEQLRVAVRAVEQGTSPRVPMVPPPKAYTPPYHGALPSPTESTFTIPPPVPEDEDATMITIKGFHSVKGRQTFAEQLTLLTADLFGRIQPGLLVEYWSLTSDEREEFEQHRDGPASLNVLAYRDFEEALTLWVTSTILHPYDVHGRVDMIEFWLNVAEICLDELHNFSGASCIHAGVGYSAVKQLKKTVLSVPGPAKVKYHKLEQFFDQHGNFRAAREALAACTEDQPFIPFSALFKKDLHSFRGRAEEKKNAPPGMHNVILNDDKRGSKHIDISEEAGKGMAMATLLSRRPYNIEGDSTLQAWILKRLVNWADNSQREPYSTKLSNLRARREPRQKRPHLDENGALILTKDGKPMEVEVNPFPEYPEVWDFIPTRDGHFVRISDKREFVSKAAPASISKPKSILQSVRTKAKTIASGLRSERRM